MQIAEECGVQAERLISFNPVRRFLSLAGLHAYGIGGIARRCDNRKKLETACDFWPCPTDWSVAPLWERPIQSTCTPLLQPMSASAPECRPFPPLSSAQTSSLRVKLQTITSTIYHLSMFSVKQHWPVQPRIQLESSRGLFNLKSLTFAAYRKQQPVKICYPECSSCLTTSLGHWIEMIPEPASWCLFRTRVVLIRVYFTYRMLLRVKTNAKNRSTKFKFTSAILVTIQQLEWIMTAPYMRTMPNCTHAANVASTTDPIVLR